MSSKLFWIGAGLTASLAATGAMAADYGYGGPGYGNSGYGSDRAIPLHDPSHSKVSSRDKPAAVHPAPLSAGVNAMTLLDLCIGSASSAGVAAQFAASCRWVAVAIKALRQVPAV